MGEQYGVDTSSLNINHNSSFPGTVNAEATIQGNKIDFAPGKDSEHNIKHEVGHFITNEKRGTPPKADAFVNGQPINTTDEKAADKIADAPLQRKTDTSFSNQNSQSNTPSSSPAPIQRLKDDDSNINISDLSYGQAHTYLTQVREKAINGEAHPNLTVSDTDLALLQARVDTTGADVTTLRCVEGEFVQATADQEVDFVGMSSCMAITCIMQDGSKIAAHDALENRVPGGGAVAKLAVLVEQHESTVNNVKAVGIGSCWGPHMETSQQLIDSIVMPEHFDGDVEAYKNLKLRAASIESNKDDFIQYLEDSLGNNATFKDIGRGGPKILANGDLYYYDKEEYYKELINKEAYDLFELTWTPVDVADVKEAVRTAFAGEGVYEANYFDQICQQNKLTLESMIKFT
ncbi:hypothetical protein M23134_04622 [Microscilla marina ATCC 23134]|uniref:DUF4157 domain-containing protein n=2 Tax=Microscilla marina TaxID=1027 RepID=A1ZTC2_MICM2|nr:hypothetical protein M23134_04622 [Microscilla marina ATCC 23134]